jgi:hypothetical protein
MSHVLEIINLFERAWWKPPKSTSDLELTATWAHGKAQRRAMKKWQKKINKSLKKAGIHDPDDD